MSSETPAGTQRGVAAEEFRRACGRFGTGIAIASVVDDNGTPHGLTISSFTSVSLDPPLVLICLGHAVTSIDTFRKARFFGLSLLRDDQREISDRFARKGEARFEGIAWRRGETGVPLLNGVLAEMECAVERRIEAGDHDILIGKLVAAKTHPGEPLIHYAGRYRSLVPKP